MRFIPLCRVTSGGQILKSSQILFILAGNDDIHKSLDEFEIRPDPIMDHRVSCSRASKKTMLPLFLVSQF